MAQEEHCSWLQTCLLTPASGPIHDVWASPSWEHSSWKECGLGRSCNQYPGQISGTSPSCQLTVKQGHPRPRRSQGQVRTCSWEMPFQRQWGGRELPAQGLCSEATLAVGTGTSQEPAPSRVQELPAWGRGGGEDPICPPEPLTLSIPRGLEMGGQWMHQQLPLVGEVVG